MAFWTFFSHFPVMKSYFALLFSIFFSNLDVAAPFCSWILSYVPVDVLLDSFYSSRLYSSCFSTWSVSLFHLLLHSALDSSLPCSAVLLSFSCCLIWSAFWFILCFCSSFCSLHNLLCSGHILLSLHVFSAPSNLVFSNRSALDKPPCFAPAS